MPRTGFKIKGLKRWQKAINARGFDDAARRHMRTATALNGKVAEKLMRSAIQSGGKLKRNAALTQAIKGDNKPLVDDATLFQSITSKIEDDFTVFVGVLRTDRSFEVASMVHEGAEAKVSKKMRGLFFALWKASIGELDPDKLRGRAKELYERMQEGWYPLKNETEVIIIPARQWVVIAFKNTQMIKQARDNWKRALEAAFAERARVGD